jgi:serine/threonine transporter
MSSLANAKEGHDSNMKIIIILYLASTLLGALVAVVGSFLFPVKMSVAGVDSATNTAPEGIGQVLHNLLMNVIDNPVHALANANYLGILA